MRSTVEYVRFPRNMRAGQGKLEMLLWCRIWRSKVSKRFGYRFGPSQLCSHRFCTGRTLPRIIQRSWLPFIWQTITTAKVSGLKQHYLKHFDSKFFILFFPYYRLSKRSFTISAKIRNHFKHPINEILFMLKSNTSGRVFYTVLEIVADDRSLRLSTWNLPIGWPPAQPISSTVVSHQTAVSMERLVSRDWQVVTLSK